MNLIVTAIVIGDQCKFTILLHMIQSIFLSLHSILKLMIKMQVWKTHWRKSTSATTFWETTSPQSSPLG